MPTDYDKVAKQYVDPNRLEHPIRQTVYAQWLKSCGQLKGKRAIDFGCGAGASTLMLADAGAAYVLGIDKFKKMISLAHRTVGKYVGNHVKLVRADMFEPLQLEKFDLATAVLSVHYAQKQDELNNFFLNITGALSPSGKFVALMMDPENPIMTYKPGAMCESRWLGTPFKEGSPIEVDLYGADGNKLTSVIDYHWNTSTYEYLMKKHGLTDICWIKDGILMETPLIILTARKEG